jgi:cytochrome P450
MTAVRSLGEVYDPLGAHLQDPYPFYARARRDEPVFFSPVVGAWILTRYDDVRQVLRAPEVFSSARKLRPLAPLPPTVAAVLREGYQLDPPGLMLSDGPGHRRLRAPVAHALSPARVDAAEPFIRRRAEELVDALAGDRHVELMSRYANLLPLNVISHLCDLAPEDEPVAFAGSYRASRVFFVRLPEPEQVAAARDSVAFQRLCGSYVRIRHADPGDDLVSELVTAVAPGGGPLPLPLETQLARTLMTVILAGHVTTAGLIGAAVRHLLANREQWELLCQRPALIPQAVEEAARYDTPTHAFLRLARHEVTVGGIRLPAGSEVLAVFAAANRDPALCKRPEEFDITRPPTRHLAFGAGPHACVGALLGRRQAEVTLEVLTRRLPNLRLVPDQDFKVQGDLVVRSLSALRLAW